MTMTAPRMRARETAAPLHRFAIGQTVCMKSWTGLSLKGAMEFRVTATLPVKDGSPQYRIRNDDERHERVATEDNLERVAAP